MIQVEIIPRGLLRFPVAGRQRLSTQASVHYPSIDILSVIRYHFPEKTKLQTL